MGRAKARRKVVCPFGWHYLEIYMVELTKFWEDEWMDE